VRVFSALGCSFLLAANLRQLNYLLQRPRFLATCVFGVAFILVGNASANALSFAGHILAAAGYSGSLTNSVRVVAIVTVTAVGLLHGLWRNFGIAVNNVFAFIKILILVMFIIIGFASIGGKVFGVEPPAGANLDPNNSFSGAQTEPYGYASAYLAIVFTFGGFNQANYVRGKRLLLICRS
jgi:amino acid transporter